ncbi:hypothetical protein [Winogradskyella bathintestinalis]|uniref:Uncharacterized protein n=1 Tax=Winogradskyella bathintestinalis TaxID=3035208 RepID=A0ABT7ZU45_9FLAO|nr:hypothetical protein [Winogradskyella bathintestinalis]MDN3492491.1 hypothetical protein [Winogradskyella bathintestinalis]
MVYPDDLVNFHKTWDKQLTDVFDRITDHNQPLKVLLKDDLWHKIERIVFGKETMDSILKNYYNVEK